MKVEGTGNDRPTVDIFWGEIAPCEHLVQIYEEDGALLDALEGFVTGGIQSDEAVIVIASPAHLRALERRVRARGVDVDVALMSNQYIARDAEELLGQFMVNGWPNDELFGKLVRDLVDRARRGGRRVRAFGEMVALLWAQGSCEAVVRLEHLWHRLCHEKSFSLFCAYPQVGFTCKSAQSSFEEICAAHTRVVRA